MRRRAVPGEPGAGLRLEQPESRNACSGRQGSGHSPSCFGSVTDTVRRIPLFGFERFWSGLSRRLAPQLQTSAGVVHSVIGFTK